MPTENILQLLISERNRLDRAIQALSDGTAVKRLGRPKKNASINTATRPEPTRTKRKGPTFSAAQKKKIAERMRAYWAAKKKAGKKAAKKTA